MICAPSLFASLTMIWYYELNIKSFLVNKNVEPAPERKIQQTAKSFVWAIQWEPLLISKNVEFLGYNYLSIFCCQGCSEVRRYCPALTLKNNSAQKILTANVYKYTMTSNPCFSDPKRTTSAVEFFFFDVFVSSV